MGNNNLYAAAVTLNWDANSEPELAGYKIYYGTSSGDYANSVDVGKITSFNVSNLREDTTYYFAATAYDSSDQESDFSDEVSHYVPVPEPVVVDTDGDGITDDDEMNVYGTDPYNADTDMDGISDSQEISSGADPLISNFDCKIWLEAEKGVLHTPFEIADDAQSSDNSYIWVPNGGGSDGYAEYTFEIQESGDYVFWGRALSSSGTDNSFYVSVDNSESIRWNTKVGEDWIWDPMNSDNASLPIIFYLDEGTHSLIIKQREDGTKLDKILITNDIEYLP
jgi:hypothetical protein